MKRIAKKFEIDIIHSWMYHSHLISLVYFFLDIKSLVDKKSEYIEKKFRF